MTATIHGLYQRLDFTARTGSLLVAVDAVDQQIRDSDGVVVFSGPLEVQLVDGEATVVVPPTDDGTLVPSGATYTVTEKLDDVPRDQWRRVTFLAPDGTTVELAQHASEVEGTIGNYPPPASQADVNALTVALAGEVTRAEAAEELTADDLAGHVGNHSNPHAVTKAQVGLGSADNTDDLHKPVSADQAAAIAAAADAVTAALSSRMTSDEAEVDALATLVGALQTLSDATLSAAVQAKVDAAVTALLNGAPGYADTLKELADILASDESGAAALTTAVAALRNLTDSTHVAALDALYVRRANNLSDLASASTARGNLGLGTSATLDVPSSGNAASGQVVKGSDGRLSDARTPTAHTHTEADVTGLTTDLAGKVGTGRQILPGTGLTGGGDLTADRTLAVDFVTSGGTSSSKAVRADDSRLADTRTPTDATVTAAKVAGSLKPSGTAATTDEALRALGTAAGTAAAGNDGRLSDTRTPTDATVTAAKVAGSLKPSGTAATSDEALRALGTAAGTAAAGNDSRLSDARTPTAHAASHNLGGSDALTFPTRILAVSTPTVSPGIVNTTAESNLFALTVPAAQVAAGDVLVFEGSFDSQNNSGSASTLTLKLKLGATTVITSGAISLAANAVRYAFTVRVSIILAGTADERWAVTILGSSASSARTLVGAECYVMSTSSAEDLTTDKTLALTATLGTAASTIDVRPVAGVLYRVR